MTKVNEDGSFNIQEVVETRKQIEKELNTPGANPVCKGCPLVEELPDCSPDDEEIYYICKGFNLGESHHCNFRCAYCAFNKQGLCAEPRRVTMAPIIKFLLENRMLADDAYISIAGGEPLLMPDFDESLNLLVQSGEKAITVNTNLSVWSNALAEALRTGNVLIRCSVDSGTPETFGKLKGRDLFWRVVENINRYASIDPDQVILKYICIHHNCNDSDLLGALNILNYARNRLLIDFDYYEPPDRRILRFAGKFKALADLNGVNADIRYDAELNWPRPIHLRKRLDAYELLHLGKIFKYSNGKLIRSGNYRSASQLFRGYVDILQYDERNGLSIAGWAWDHVSGAPQAIRVYAGNQIVFVGKPHTVRIDIEAGARAGFTFRRQQNPVLRNIMANGAAPEVFATFDGLKWDKLPVGADAANSQPMS
ncbi:MAG: radical SAM protein [Desulfovibrio sp.]|nr:radical SAM protein [Desulfovibrio sp.]